MWRGSTDHPRRIQERSLIFDALRYATDQSGVADPGSKIRH
jgi:hypothetical protein